jgi:peptidoglycan/xylan/chitin deacetylase (PgdA/CDA1 family)
MALDHFFTLYFFRYLKRLLVGDDPFKVNILMYHSISDDVEKGHPYFWLNTPPEVFAEQMRFLQEHNFRVIPLLKAVELIQDSKMVPGQTGILGPPSKPEKERIINLKKKNRSQFRYVVLTFDDGYRDFYSRAFPILKRYGYQAAVFLPTAFIDGSIRGLRDKRHLNWDQVQELHGCGVLFGSHTKTHPKLYDISWNAIGRELSDSKQQLESKLRVPVQAFAYPYAYPKEDRSFVNRFMWELKNQGYLAAVTTSIGQAGPSSNPFCLMRLPVNKRDTGPIFKAKLEGAYNWLGYAQRFKRHTKYLLPFKRGRKGSV